MARRRLLALAFAVLGACSTAPEPDASRDVTAPRDAASEPDEGRPDAPDAEDASVQPDVPFDAAPVVEDAASPPDAPARDDAFDAPSPDAPFDAPSPMDAAVPADVPPLPATLLFNLRSAPFPGTGHPDVAVHVPPGFRLDDRPGLIVFFHGHSNCVANVVGSVDSACPPNTARRGASHLNAQLDAARVNAVLVAVQLRYDTASGDPGALRDANSLDTLLHELFVEHLSPALGARVDVDSFERVVIGTFSGGYIAAAAVLDHGGVPHISEVDLYDSLYGETAKYRAWFDERLERFAAGRPDGTRFVDLYTAGGGTDGNSRTFAAGLRAALTAGGLSGSFYQSDRAGTLAPGAEAHPVVFQFASQSHEDVPRTYFGRLAAASGFAPVTP